MIGLHLMTVLLAFGLGAANLVLAKETPRYCQPRLTEVCIISAWKAEKHEQKAYFHYLEGQD